MKKIVFALLLIAVFGGVQVVSAQYNLYWYSADNMVYPPGVLEFCSDPNGLPLTAELVSGPAHGRVNLYPHGGFQYDGTDWPFTGEDSFTFRTYNGYEYSEPIYVSIFWFPCISCSCSVTGVEDTYSVSADSILNIPAPGILGNDCGTWESSILAYLIESPEHGYLDLNSDGSFTYTPDAGFIGTDSFLYVAYYSDYHDGFSFYTPVTITVCEPEISVPEFPGMFVMICGIILGIAFIAARVRIRR
jgi:hypothetical protein